MAYIKSFWLLKNYKPSFVNSYYAELHKETQSFAKKNKKDYRAKKIIRLTEILISNKK